MSLWFTGCGVTGENLRGVVSLVQAWSLETECVLGSREAFM